MKREERIDGPGTAPACLDDMIDLTDAIPLLVRRAEGLATAMVTFAADDAYGAERPSVVTRRRALALAGKSRALAAALGLAEGDEVLTAANELTDLEEEAAILRRGEPDTVRPPPSESGTFLVERKKASTNRLLALRT